MEAAVGKWAGRAVAAAASRQRAFACDAPQCLGVERVYRFRSSEACLVADPQAAVLLPWEVGQEVVFGIDVVAERAGAEEGVDEATVRELTEDLEPADLA